MSESDWFRLGSELHDPILRTLYEVCEHLSIEDANLKIIPHAAAIHFLHCFSASENLNTAGQHAVAIALVRQCVEALTVVEAGLQDGVLRDELLRGWMEGRFTQGQLRKKLEQEAWGSYGNGLREEEWATFYAEFAQAVQPYAHYTQQLQAWQLAVLRDQPARRLKDGSLLLLSTIGLKTYDSNKASRITLYHCLLLWVVARVLLARGAGHGLTTDVIAALGAALGKSEFLGGGNLSWHQEFWATEIDLPSGER